uniref:Fe2OG dioxygenase domain-containing protein n=1 Tax=Physcomitrium patens TaxID=3218 RepID=A0A7I4CR67_PHYPA
MGVDGSDGGYPLECINMASPDKHETAARVREACVTSGFFYLVNHGVDSALLDEVFVQSKKFFALPLEEKMKVIHDKNHRGYTPFEEEVLDPGTQSRGDSKEGYYIGFSVPESDPRSKKPMHGPNQYPSPDLLPGWEETMTLYHSELVKLSKRVSRLLALALDLEETFFDKPGITDDPVATLRLLHYSAEKSNVELGIFGTGAHSDYGLLTLLATDDVPGLQICKYKDAQPQVWEDVPPMKGSTLHRVVSRGIERYSIPFFFEPNFDCLVECLPTCCSEDNPPRYPPLTVGEHLVNKYKETHKGFVSDQKSLNYSLFEGQ